MLTIKYQKILKENNLFMDLDDDEFRQIIAQSSYCELKKRQYLFQKNQPATNFFLVVHGKIKLSVLSAKGNEKVVDIINPGNTFAEAIMFLEKKKYPLDATALINSSVLQISTSCYLNILEKSPKACFKIMASLSQKLRWSLTEMSNLSLHDSTCRLINFLLKNAEQIEQNLQVNLSIPRSVLANHLSITPETLSRIFNKLAKQGLIQAHNNCIVLLKPLELKNIIRL